MGELDKYPLCPAVFLGKGWAEVLQAKLGMPVDVRALCFTQSPWGGDDNGPFFCPSCYWATLQCPGEQILSLQVPAQVSVAQEGRERGGGCPGCSQECHNRATLVQTWPLHCIFCFLVWSLQRGALGVAFPARYPFVPESLGWLAEVNAGFCYLPWSDATSPSLRLLQICAGAFVSDDDDPGRCSKEGNK